MQPAVVPARVHLFVPIHVASTQAPAVQPSARFVAVPLVSSKLLASAFLQPAFILLPLLPALSLIWLLTSC